MIKIFTIYLLILLMSCATASKNRSSYKGLPDIQGVNSAIEWASRNLHYKNVDPWDPAPSVESILRDGYGDCKMLAAVISVLLDKVGQENFFVVIKDKYWHMFNVYKTNGSFRVVDNTKLKPQLFSNMDEIKKCYGVDDFVKVFGNYEDFRKWFNEEIYPNP